MNNGMTCKLCNRRIKTESEEFEEVGSIEFAHVECVDEQEVRSRKQDTDEVEINT